MQDDLGIFAESGMEDDLGIFHEPMEDDLGIWGDDEPPTLPRETMPDSGQNQLDIPEQEPTPEIPAPGIDMLSPEPAIQGEAPQQQPQAQVGTFEADQSYFEDQDDDTDADFEAVNREIDELEVDVEIGNRKAQIQQIFGKGQAPIPDTSAMVGDSKEEINKKILEGFKPAGRTLENIGQVYPVVEAALTVGSGLVGGALSGLAGMATLALFTPGDTDAAEEVMALVQKYTTFQPITERGKELSETLVYPLKKLGELGQYLGDAAAKKYGWAAGATVKTAIEAIPLAFPFARKAPKLVKHIQESNLYRRATIQERAVVVQSIEEVIKKNPQLTEAQLARMSDDLFQRSVGKRQPVKEPVKPTDKPVIEEISKEITESAKPKEVVAGPVKKPVEAELTSKQRIMEGLKKAPIVHKSVGEPVGPTGAVRTTKPLITEGQKKSIEKKKAVKKAQINIESAKEAAAGVREMIIERRKSLNLSTYETNLFVNAIEKVTTKAQREVVPFIIEGTDIPKELNRPDLEKAYARDRLDKQLEPIAVQIKKHFDEGWQMMKQQIPDMSAEQIENYVTHIWDLNKKQKSVVTNWFITQNRFLKKRYIETIHEGITKLGLKPRTLDVAEIIRIHDSVANRAIENAKFVKDLKQLKKDGVSLIERADKAPQGWVLFDHPALRRGLVIPGEAKMGEKVSPELQSLLEEMGVAIGRRISPVTFGKLSQTKGSYRDGEPPEVRFQRFMSTGTIAHEIGHHIDKAMELGEKFLSDFKTELYAINRERIESRKGKPGKYGEDYARSTPEQIAEFFSVVFTDIKKAYRLAPNATTAVLERLKQDGVMSKLVDFDFEKNAKNLIEEQLNTLVKLPVKVHPDLVKPLRVIFDSRFDHPAIQAYEMINGILKKTKLSFSLFHHVALGETGVATMGSVRTLGIYLNPVKLYRAIAKGEYAIYEKEALAREWIGAGLQVGATHDIPVSMIQNKLNDLVRKTKSVPLANKATQLIATFNEVWDKALWNYLHDTLKLYACESLGLKMDPTKPLGKQREEIAQFVNDTFGGQNWDMLMVSPKTLQIMTWSLLSPDWTLSTIRQALAPTGLGAIHRETKGLRKKLGRHFWIKAGLYFGVGINMLNYTFRKWDEKENPKYYKDEKRDFWDRTMAGNAIGKKTNLFVGRYEDGTERYIRWGKQFRELPEMFFDDTGFSPISATIKKIGGKTAPLFQLASQITTGVSPSGFRNDDVYGKKGWDKTYGIFKTILKSPLPFSSRSLLVKNKKFHITDLAFPSSKGMTRYRAIEFFKHAIVKDDERFLKEVYQDAQQNNLPAYTLFSAAITSLKAETTRELNKTRKDTLSLTAILKTAIKNNDYVDMKRRINRYIRLRKEEITWSLASSLYATALIEAKKYHRGEISSSDKILDLLKTPTMIDQKILAGIAKKSEILWAEEFTRARTNKEKEVVLKKLLEAFRSGL